MGAVWGPAEMTFATERMLLLARVANITPLWQRLPPSWSQLRQFGRFLRACTQ